MLHTSQSELSWNSAREHLRDSVGDDAYKHWFSRVLLESVAYNTAHISVPTLFLKRWICAHYIKHITECMRSEYPEVENVSITVRTHTRTVNDPVPGNQELMPENTIIDDKDCGVDVETTTQSPQHLGKVQEIQRFVADCYGISHADMLSHKRPASVILPRQVAMYLAKSLTSLSLPAIGRRFKRDHTTVLYAVRKVEKRLKRDAKLAAYVEDITRQLSA